MQAIGDLLLDEAVFSDMAAEAVEWRR